MRLNFSRSKEYVPEFNSNKLALPEDQITFKLKPMDLGDWTDTFEKVSRMIGADGKVDTAKLSASEQKDFLLLGLNIIPKYVEQGRGKIFAEDGDEPLSIQEIASLPQLVGLNIELMWAVLLNSTPTQADEKNSTGQQA